MPKPGVLWRPSDGSILATGPTGRCPDDLFQKQYTMSKAGDEDTACTSLTTISKEGFDPVKFVQPSEGAYRQEFSAHMRKGRVKGVGARHA